MWRAVAQERRRSRHVSAANARNRRFPRKSAQSERGAGAKGSVAAGPNLSGLVIVHEEALHQLGLADRRVAEEDDLAGRKSRRGGRWVRRRTVQLEFKPAALLVRAHLDVCVRYRTRRVLLLRRFRAGRRLCGEGARGEGKLGMRST